MLSLQLPELTVYQVSTEYPPGRINGQSTISILDRYRSILFTITEKKEVNDRVLLEKSIRNCLFIKFKTYYLFYFYTRSTYMQYLSYHAGK